MYTCPGLDDTDDATCDNLVEKPQLLCHDCGAEQIDILRRITLARQAREAEGERKEAGIDWARRKTMFRVALPVLIVLASPLLLLLEASRPFLDSGR